jgi:hypothetical protein
LRENSLSSASFSRNYNKKQIIAFMQIQHPDIKTLFISIPKKQFLYKITTQISERLNWFPNKKRKFLLRKGAKKEKKG